MITPFFPSATKVAEAGVWSVDFFRFPSFPRSRMEVSDHQQSWGYEDGPWKRPGPPLLVAADF
jgi:hypothetical protein